MQCCQVTKLSIFFKQSNHRINTSPPQNHVVLLIEAIAEILARKEGTLPQGYTVGIG